MPYPLGASFDGHGVNFALYSEHGTSAEVCLYDVDRPEREIGRVTLVDQTHHVFHGYVPGVEPGALYGFRVDGPWDPSQGFRFNPNKLLVDPYAKAISGKPDWRFHLLGHAPDQSRDPHDSAEGAPRSVVVNDAFDWSGDKRPEVLWRKAVVYELHIKGFTASHPDVPAELRGTYAGLGHPSVIKHLTSLGVTSVELLPLHESVPEGFLAERKLTNFWGYNTLGFFAPDQRFSSSGSRGGQVAEFKQLVKTLHQAGLEVILDVVFNHSCEGNHLGPTLSFRGLDNTTYYWLEEHDGSKYRDFTGCGNSLDASHSQVVKLILDSLRYWASEMRVDGFRFDLATTLARGAYGEFDPRSIFFAAVHQDPVLSRVKLIAEPWDVGPSGYRTGNFPAPFSEWNDRYRQTVRRFWRGDAGQVADLGYRLTGSSDLLKLSGRRPSATVNYVACHDGFTLHDLVTYSHKHNELNGEDNRDGADENHSSHWGVEGEVDDPLVNELRERIKRNFLATLFLSVGTPMLMAGDEFGRTQKGNNNAYCQDNGVSYVNWQLNERQRALLEFTKQCIALRNAQPVLQRRNFFLGSALEDSHFKDLVWFHPLGRELERHDWENAELRCFGMFLGGDAIATRDPLGQKVTGDTLLIYCNATGEAVDLKLPANEWGDAWSLLLETSRAETKPFHAAAASTFSLPARSVAVFVQQLVMKSV